MLFKQIGLYDRTQRNKFSSIDEGVYLAKAAHLMRGAVVHGSKIF